jgi:hypothetical protein
LTFERWASIIGAHPDLEIFAVHYIVVFAPFLSCVLLGVHLWQILEGGSDHDAGAHH